MHIEVNRVDTGHEVPSIVIVPEYPQASRVRLDRTAEGASIMWEVELNPLEALKKALPALPNHEADDVFSIRIPNTPACETFPASQAEEVLALSAKRPVAGFTLDIGPAVLAWNNSAMGAKKPWMVYEAETYSAERTRVLLAHTSDVHIACNLDDILATADQYFGQ